MANSVDNHYDRVMNLMNAGKDSIFEPCKILEYYPDKLVVDVFCTTSKQTKENATLLFPSLFLNSGIIAPPAKYSTALLFWGPDKQAFVLPAQYTIPSYEVSKKGQVSVNASPSKVDDVFDLRNIEQGEMMLRALGGSYVYIKNSGDVELSTPKLHKVSLRNSDGKFSVISEAVEHEINSFKYYNGLYQSKTELGEGSRKEHHISIKSNDVIPDFNEVVKMSDKEMLERLFVEQAELSVGYSDDFIWDLQMLNVFDEADNKMVSDLDDSELFLLSRLYEKDAETNQLRCKIEVTKKGALSYETLNDASSTKITVTADDVSVDVNGTKLNIKDGDIKWLSGDKEYSLNSVVERLNLLSSNAGLTEL